MKKICLVLLISLLGVFGLCSCNNGGEDIPEGLQLVYESRADGYKFYGPEGWAVVNRGGIAASYVTAVNNTSITFTKADAPEGEVAQYFDTHMAALPYEINILKRDEPTSFGNADSAYKYVFTYKYQDYDFACMQILVFSGEDFYIFTYNSYGDANDESSDYRTYLEKIQLSIDNFKFTAKSDSAESKDYPTDSDGYAMISDKSLAGFELYVPKSYTVIDSGAIVSAKISDGANISISKASGTGVSIGDYWKARKNELSLVVGEITVIKENVINGGEDKVVLGNLASNRVAAYEYTYSFGGNTYHVYQIFGVDSFNGYSFTYTALDSEYSEHLDEIMTILEKVKFK